MAAMVITRQRERVQVPGDEDTRRQAGLQLYVGCNCVDYSLDLHYTAWINVRYSRLPRASRDNVIGSLIIIRESSANRGFLVYEGP